MSILSSLYNPYGATSGAINASYGASPPAAPVPGAALAALGTPRTPAQPPAPPAGYQYIQTADGPKLIPSGFDLKPGTPEYDAEWRRLAYTPGGAQPAYGSGIIPSRPHTTQGDLRIGEYMRAGIPLPGWKPGMDPVPPPVPNLPASAFLDGNPHPEQPSLITALYRNQKFPMAVAGFEGGGSQAPAPTSVASPSSAMNNAGMAQAAANAAAIVGGAAGGAALPAAARGALGQTVNQGAPAGPFGYGSVGKMLSDPQDYIAGQLKANRASALPLQLAALYGPGASSVAPYLAPQWYAGEQAKTANRQALSLALGALPTLASMQRAQMQFDPTLQLRNMKQQAYIAGRQKAPAGATEAQKHEFGMAEVNAVDQSPMGQAVAGMQQAGLLQPNTMQPQSSTSPAPSPPAPNQTPPASGDDNRPPARADLLREVNEMVGAGGNWEELAAKLQNHPNVMRYGMPYLADSMVQKGLGGEPSAILRALGTSIAAHMVKGRQGTVNGFSYAPAVEEGEVQGGPTELRTPLSMGPHANLVLNWPRLASPGFWDMPGFRTASGRADHVAAADRESLLMRALWQKLHPEFYGNGR